MKLKDIGSAIRNIPKPPKLSNNSSSNEGSANIIYPEADYSAEIAECRRQIELCNETINKNKAIIDEYTTFSREVFNCQQ